MNNTLFQPIFRTCQWEDDYPSNYWAILRIDKLKTKFWPGASYSRKVSDKGHSDMKKILLNRVNNQSSYDQPMTMYQNDILVISIGSFHEIFTFRYEVLNWKPFRQFDHNDVMNNYRQIKEGTLKDEWVNLILTFMSISDN